MDNFFDELRQCYAVRFAGVYTVAAGLLILSLTTVSVASETPTTIASGWSYKIDSKALAGSREINVWLPADYESSGRNYNVLYIVDGGLDQDFHHISGLAQLSTINGTFETPIVVGVKTENRLWELTSAITDERFAAEVPPGGGSDAFRDHLKDDVIAFIEERYRVSQRRILVGESLAGLFIVETFLKTPALFTDYISVSPSLWWDDKVLASNAGQLLLEHKYPFQYRLYLTMGNEGGSMQRGLDMVVEALERGTPELLEWQYVDRRESETHRSIYHGAVHDALLKFFPIPEPDYGPRPWYLIEE